MISLPALRALLDDERRKVAAARAELVAAPPPTPPHGDAGDEIAAINAALCQGTLGIAAHGVAVPETRPDPWVMPDGRWGIARGVVDAARRRRDELEREFHARDAAGRDARRQEAERLLRQAVMPREWPDADEAARLRRAETRPRERAVTNEEGGRRFLRDFGAWLEASGCTTCAHYTEFEMMCRHPRRPIAHGRPCASRVSREAEGPPCPPGLRRLLDAGFRVGAEVTRIATSESVENEALAISVFPGVWDEPEVR